MTNIIMIILRIIHIFAGVFWVGGLFFFIRIVSPTVSESGPDGGKFMQRLAAAGRMAQAFGGAAVLTLLSGLIMYWIDSAGLNPNWLRSGPATVLTIGGIAGLLAAGHGLFATRPLSNRLGALAKEMLALKGPPSPEQVQQAQGMGAKLGSLTVQTAILVAIALLGMATWRYFTF